MNSAGCNSGDGREAGERPPFVDPNGLSLTIAQKLAEPLADIPPPRLSIVHLFLWTTITAVIMALGRSVFLRQQAEFESDGVHALSIAHWYMMSALYGLICSGLIVAVCRKRRSPTVRLEPGERLLVVRGISFVVQMATYALMNLLFGTESYNVEMYVAIQAISLSADLALSVWAVVRTDRQPAWRRFFAIAGIAAVANLVLMGGTDAFIWLSWATVIFYVMVVIECVLLVLAIRGDRARSMTRNWLHWFGVFTFIFSTGFFVIWDILWRYLPSQLS
jgi:hypothetical protein